MKVCRRRFLCKRAAAGGLLVLAAAANCAVSFAAPVDSTLEKAASLLHRAVAASRDTPLRDNPDAGQILTALRSAKDAELLPIFEKLRASTVVDNQIFGMVAAAILTKDGNRVDLKLLFSGTDQSLVGAAIAGLIDQEVLNTDQLMTILTTAPDGAHKAMAGGELSRRKELKDRGPLLALLKDEKDSVKYYAAVTLLDSQDPAEVAQAQALLKSLGERHDLRMAPIQALMLVRVQKENLTAAAPWAAQLAGDAQSDQGLRYTAVSALLSLKTTAAGANDGPRILADMIAQERDSIEQIKLGLIAIEHAEQLKPIMLDPLIASRSGLAKTIGTLAQQRAQGGDNTAGLLSLIKEGHPIVLDWALAYTDRTEGARRLAIRTALVNQATIVDNQRDRDYERAAIAAQKILDEDGAPGRAAVKDLLRSDNRAAVEATLAGIYRSTAANQAELVAPIWEGLTKTSSTEIAANYAALILAREGKKEPLSWLPGMVVGGTAQSGGGQGLRALAAWDYAKLKGQTAELLKYVLAD